MKMARELLAAMEMTWPAARVLRVGDWELREGLGGGQRVSAATAVGPGAAGQIAEAEAGMQALGQVPLFMLRPEVEGKLDAELEARGYVRHDPVVVYRAEVATIAMVGRIGDARWPVGKAAVGLWAGGGIGPARLAVMERVKGPKAGVMVGGGVGFVAVSGGVAAVHALFVEPGARRQGLGRALMATAAHWARTKGAKQMALAVTRGNVPARALYAGLGMDEVGQYHYRIKAADLAGQ